MINNTNVENKYTTNGSLATVYPITFQGATSTSGVPHLNITLKTADGTSERQLVYNVDYELVREEIDPSVPQTESMSVPPVIGIKLLNAEDAASGNSLTITRETPFVQHIDYQVGRIDPKQVERAADLDVLRDQELRHRAEEISDVADEALETATEGVELATAAQEDIDGHEADLNNPHQTSLAKLTDTEIAGLVTGQFLMYDGLKWKNVNSSTTASWGTILGNLIDQTDLKNALDGKVNIDGTSIMTAPLKFMSGSVRGAVGPYFNGVGFWKLDSQGNLTQIASISDSQFIPTTTNAIDIGNSTKKWKDLYLGGKAYVATINAGSDITVPNSTGEMLVNSATHSTSLSIYGTPASGINTINIGRYTTATGVNSIMIGNYAKAGEGAMAFGNGAEAASYGFAYLGKTTVSYAYQIGRGTNSESYTLYVGWSDANNYKLLDGTTGIIPSARLATTSSATEGQVLTLDSSLNAIWADASGGTSNYHPDLFDWKWADHQLNDVQWLRADTFSWQSGSVYESAYQHLVDDLGITQTTYYAWYDSGDDVRYYTLSETPSANDALYQEVSGSMVEVSSESAVLSSYDSSTTPPHIRVWTLGGTESYYRDTSNDITISRAQTETIAGVTITYYPSADGHKIVLADQETNVTAIYNATGVAWYYILDNANQRFKLPRAKPLNGAIVGNGIALGLTNGTINAGLSRTTNASYLDSFQNLYGANVGTIGSGSSGGNGAYGVTTDGTKSGIIVERDNTDQYKYLYFYVGEFTQTAIENTAGLNAELFNDKADKDFGNTTMIDYVVAYQNPTADNSYTWYRKYKSGWVEQGGKASTMNTTIYLPVVMADTNYVVTCGFTIANKGAQSVTKYTDRFTTSSNTNTSYTSGGWIVMGMAAS